MPRVTIMRIHLGRWPQAAAGEQRPTANAIVLQWIVAVHVVALATW